MSKANLVVLHKSKNCQDPLISMSLLHGPSVVPLLRQLLGYLSLMQLTKASCVPGHVNLDQGLLGEKFHIQEEERLSSRGGTGEELSLEEILKKNLR